MMCGLAVAVTLVGAVAVGSAAVSGDNSNAEANIANVACFTFFLPQRTGPDKRGIAVCIWPTLTSSARNLSDRVSHSKLDFDAMDFAGQSALVTGGAGGLGGATARRLVELGMHVVVFEPDGARASAFAAELGNATGTAGDHNDERSVLAAIDLAKGAGKFSVNVNAAGVSVMAPATTTADGIPHDMALFRQLIDLHLMGPFNVSRLCSAAMASNEPDGDGQRGLIVNTASTAAFDGQARQVGYSAGKAAIVAMTLSMARDLADIGVRAMAIAPGPIWTPRLSGAPEALKAALISNVAFPKRFGQPEEYAQLVEAFLRTPFLNGQTVRLDGAMSTPLTNLMGKP